MNETKLQKVLAKHKKWLADEEGGEFANLRGADLMGTNLMDANLMDADLARADLRGADLDYSCWPLWCGSKGVKVDRKIAAQFAAHFCALDCDDPDYITARDAVMEFAESSHHAEELGLIEREKLCTTQ